ncbi:hypothetical protein DAPPUDRAFT_103606 [Daphnia pulex]|uniref:Uncharacterized protein n=1 Tax=Daphnia pulex TaxID=6669 RepID=E9GJM6_DAPPU|nr:hypothetical protein DAPPUDRAFT_103606 [Daphnia pulex]|eukprot:EFX80289.1 hypothetical protein DAPPUDRAFT_103606 [Daphnia pulex]
MTNKRKEKVFVRREVGSDLASQDKLFEGTPVDLDTDANIILMILSHKPVLFRVSEEVADSLNDLDGDYDQDDWNDWDLYLEDLDEGLSFIARQQLFRKRIATRTSIGTV